MRSTLSNEPHISAAGGGGGGDGHAPGDADLLPFQAEARLMRAKRLQRNLAAV